MKKNKTRIKSIGFTILASGIAIVILLTGAIFVITYSSFSRSTKDAVTSQVGELSNQIVYNYENYINTIIETSNAIQIDINMLNIKQNDTALSDYLGGIIRLKNEIVNIAIYDRETKKCFASSDTGEIGRVVNKHDVWFYDAEAEETIHAFSIPYSEKNSENYKLNISKQIDYNKGKTQGILKIEISFENFISLAKKSNLGEDGHITIIDSDCNTVYTSAKSKDGAGGEGDIIRHLILGSQAVKMGAHDMLINIATLSNTRWRICVFINTSQIAVIEKNFIMGIAVASLVVLVLAVAIFTGIAKKITGPLKKLENTMLKIENADYFLMEEVNLKSGKEVVALSKSFNKMMKKLRELMDRVVFEQNEQRKSELKALQNQINPHFLYNTLDSIIWLIDNGKNEEASTMVISLAKLFRIGISKGNNLISVSDELEHVRHYLFIQNVRYSGCFSYDFEIDEAVGEQKLLKLILQPLVENSIYHGLKNKPEHGHIVIRAKLTGESLVLAVSDNGYGMTENKVRELEASLMDASPSEGVGLKNIYQRLKMFYGGKADLTIQSEMDEGTTITIIIDN